MRPVGFQRQCSKRTGGIVSVALICATDIVSAVYDPLSGAFTGVVLAEGAHPVTYDFREGTGRWRETVLYSDSLARVRHELTFTLCCAADGASRAAGELLALSRRGLVALVTTPAADIFLAGYSREFGSGRPLRLTACVGDRGAGESDEPGYTITLGSEDTALALRFTGSPLL